MEDKTGWIATNRIKVRTPFKNLFPIDDAVIEAIAKHMQINGFDKSQPIILWDNSKAESNKHALYLIDWHTRLAAAKRINLSAVYTVKKIFLDEGTALKYAIHNQRDRRNMTDADIIRCIEAVDSRRPRGGDHKSEDAKSKTSSEVIDFKSSAQQTAEIVGTSKSKVEKARSIMDHADEQTRHEVESGQKSINKAYKETQKRRKANANPQIEKLESMPDYIELEEMYNTFLRRLADFNYITVV